MQNKPEEEPMEKEAALAAEVERLLPGFVNSCTLLVLTIKTMSMRFWERR